MPKFKFVPETQASWMEYMYHGEVAVQKGVAETENPLTIDYLLRHGFVEVKDEPAEDAVEASNEAVDVPAQATSKSNRRSKSKRDQTDDEDAAAE